eukprot:scaffold38702_cov30-Tisochrysis_lutea.AAC.5
MEPATSSYCSTLRRPRPKSRQMPRSNIICTAKSTARAAESANRTAVGRAVPELYPLLHPQYSGSTARQNARGAGSSASGMRGMRWAACSRRMSRVASGIMSRWPTQAIGITAYATIGDDVHHAHRQQDGQDKTAGEDAETGQGASIVVQPLHPELFVA